MGILYTPLGSTANANIFCTIADGSNSQVFRDGVLAGTGNAGSNNAAFFSIGSNGALSGYFNGDIAEILIFPRALSTSERKAVENYLAKKWGLGFNPLSLSPALWLSDTGSNPAQWDDISGNNRHATQATVASQPSIIANGLGGRQVRRFDGVDDFLTPLSSLAILNSVAGGSIFAVAKLNNGNTPDQTVLHFSRNGNSSQVRLGLQLTIGSSGQNFRAGARRLDTDSFTGSTQVNNTNPNVFAAIANYSTGKIILRVNGIETETNLPSSGNSSPTNSDVVEIGKIAANHLTGDIAEILVFPSALSDTDRREVERYLAQKWNIIT
jgi:hypothetical protein